MTPAAPRPWMTRATLKVKRSGARAQPSDVSGVTLAGSPAPAPARYNGAEAGARLRPNNTRARTTTTVSRGLPDREPPAAAPAPPERRGGERRTRVLRALVYGSFNPRRRTPRRVDESTPIGVDWHHP